MNDKKLMIKSKGILNQIGLLGVIAVLCIIFTCLNEKPNPPAMLGRME